MGSAEGRGVVVVSPFLVVVCPCWLQYVDIASARKKNVLQPFGTYYNQKGTYYNQKPMFAWFLGFPECLQYLKGNLFISDPGGCSMYLCVFFAPPLQKC